MENKKLNVFYQVDQLKSHILTRVPTLYYSSQTSTVIPFEKIENHLNQNTVLGNLSQLKGELSFDHDFNLNISGFVTWKEAKEFCNLNNREIMTSPTEELASVLSGIATSCTGERSFSFKNLRSQILELTYLDYQANEIKLCSDKKITAKVDLKKYQELFSSYKDFKNAPFPRFETETDLMTGTEGQLGVITSAKIKTVPKMLETYLFILLPKWENNFEPHLEIYNKVQDFKDDIFACEFIDSNSIAYLPVEKRIGENEDIIFLEINTKKFDEIYSELISKLKFTSESKVIEVSGSKCRDFRVSVPRAIFEANLLMGVTKKGTDVQVSSEKFPKLLNFYKKLALMGIKYNLFGHFGDAHLHFNFMPDKSQENKCHLLLLELYQEVKVWQGSPFAEHGIGLIKKKFISEFYSEEQRKVFQLLKKEFDPYGQFFPEGFMSC